MQACELCLACQGRVVVSGMGKSGHIARKIAATLASTGTPAFFLHPAEASHGDLGMITRTDVVLAISNSGETPEVVLLLPHLKRLGVPLIVMTGELDSTLARDANVALDVSVPEEACSLNLAPTASTTATLAMGDALAVALLDARGFTEKDFAHSHPGGSLGRRLLLHVEDLMRTGDALPRVHVDTPLREGLLEMSRKGLGMTVVVDGNDHILGVFTDGDLRRTLDSATDVRTAIMRTVMTAQSEEHRPARARRRSRASDGAVQDHRPPSGRCGRKADRRAERSRPFPRGRCLKSPREQIESDRNSTPFEEGGHGDRASPASIELLILDVDGVLTDGRLYYGPRGEVLEGFRCEGRLRHPPAARRRRAGRDHLRSRLAAGEDNARATSASATSIRASPRSCRCSRSSVSASASPPAQCAIVGDDRPDVPVMRAVGLAFAPFDAHPAALKAADMITPNGGGRGAVRNVCDLLVARAATRQPAVHFEDPGHLENPALEARMIGRLLIGLAVVALVIGVLIFSQSGGSSLAPEDHRHDSEASPATPPVTRESWRPATMAARSTRSMRASYASAPTTVACNSKHRE